MNDMPKPPNPEEIQKEFESFIKNKFGDQVQVFAHPMPGGMPDSPQVDAEPVANDEPHSFDLNFQYTPKDIKRHLDQYVIQQLEAKKALSIAVCDHYNYVRQHHENPNALEADYAKQNVMVLGPTGVGKTYLIKQIAKFIGVPFVKADATRFSETGYVGSNVDDLIHDLVAQANGDIELAQYGIVYLDEADKLAAPANAGGRDVSGRGVQFGMLKLMEETEVDLRSGNDMRSQLQAFMEFQRKGKVERNIINTRHILFIVSGAFSGLIDIIKERMNQNNIGFGVKSTAVNKDEEFLQFARTEDFMSFGFEPEFIGRLPIRVACHLLSVDDLYSILSESRGSIIKQYQNAFRAYDIDLTFKDEALRRIAELAAAEKTGARALMTTCERVLRNFKYELPSLNISKLEVTVDLVNNPEQVLSSILSNPDLQPRLQNEEVRAYVTDFHATHGMALEFNEGATRMLVENAGKSGSSVTEVCREIFSSYEHGLKLIQQNTGLARFVITEDVIRDPKKTLEAWIKGSYGTED